MTYPNTKEGDEQREKDIENYLVKNGFITIDGHPATPEPKPNPQPEPKCNPISYTSETNSGPLFPDLDEKYLTCDLESIPPITSHILPTLTGLYALVAVLGDSNTQIENWLTLAASGTGIALRFLSKYYSGENKEYGYFSSNPKENSKIIGLTAAHIGSLLCFAYVINNSFFKLNTDASTLKKEMLVVSGAYCAYQLAAIGIKKAKLRIREY